MNYKEQAAAMSQEEIVTLLTVQASLQEQIEQLKRQLDWFKRQLFGSKSERRPVEIPPEQMSLGEMLNQTGEAQEQQPPQQKINGYTRRTGKDTSQGDANEGGLRFDETVPVELITVQDPAVKGLDPDDYEVIDEKITHRLAQQPSSYVVLKYVREVIKLKETGQIACPPAPAAVLEKSYADVSMLAGLMVDKFLYHLPLYRQHQRLKETGIELSRSVLTYWTHRAAALLEPIFDAQWASALASRVLAMDETPVKAGRIRKGKMRTAYFWPIYGDRDEVVFLYFPSRAHKHVREALKDYQGVLLSDGYDAYSKYAELTLGVILAQCWTHTRRGFVKAEDVEPVLVEIALDYIRQLYDVEAQIRKRGLSGKKKLRYRVEHSKPIVEKFFEWAQQQLLDKALLPTNPLTQALGYALERRTSLEVFLGDPDVPVDTNHLERALRVIPMGRKNWLFCWTEIGAHYVGIIQSLITTCRLQGINPYDYFVDVLQRIDTHPANKVHELTPREWKQRFADNPLRSPLYNLLRQHNNVVN